MKIIRKVIFDRGGRAFKEIIHKIETATEHQRRLELLAELETALDSEKHPRDFRVVKSLLYHRDWYIRREAAFLIDRHGVRLSEEERLQYDYALQNFSILVGKMAENPVARKLMFEACKDPSSRFRSRVPGQLSFQDCQTTAEMVLLHYAAGDYQALIELGCDEDFRQTVISILSEGMQAEKNSDYHRRQCVFALQQLDAIEDTREFVAEIISTGSAAKKESRQDFDEIKQLNMSPLEKLIHQLERWGILVDGKIIYPKIQIGSITNRITYRDPALQTWAKEERDHRIQASSDARLLKFDYRAMEPTLLLHFLLQRFLISLEDVPPDDIYLAIDGRNREAAKSWLNAVINGGGSRFAKQLNPFQTDLWQAIEELRQELLQTVYIEEAVETIAGTRIDLPKNETNLGGKALNRLIQGSASDVFNHAILSVHEHLIKENLPARIYFLLYDEVWIEVSNEIPGPFTKTIMDLLESVNTDFRLLMPLTICLQD